MSADSYSERNQHLLELSEALIRYPSTADRPEELRNIVDFVERYFAEYTNLFVRRYEQNGKPSIVVSTNDTRTPDVLLMGHLDVVPASPEMFSPVRTSDGTLVGRGACDMKSENAIMMKILADLTREESVPSVALMLTTDEEIGGHHGAKYLIQTEGYRPKLAIVPDGGEELHQLMCWNKGIVHLKLHAQGKAAHGSVPWMGENAIEKLMQGLQGILQTFPANTDESDHWYTTVNIGTFHGGAATNAVPHEAAAGVDIRYPESETAEEVLQKIRSVLPDGVTVEPLLTERSSHTSPTHPHVETYARVLREQTRQEPRFVKSPSGHDGRFLTEFGIPVIVSRPRSGDQHTEREWVDIKSLEDYYRLCHAFIREVTK